MTVFSKHVLEGIKNKSVKIISKKTVHLFIIISFYLILRVPLLGNALWHDEIYNTSLYLNRIPIISRYLEEEPEQRWTWGRDYKRQTVIHPPFLRLFYYPWIRVFGDTEISLHIATMMSGLAGIIVLYFFGSFVFGNEAGFLATLGTVFSLSHIMYSVQAVHAIFEMLVFLASIFSLCKFIITKSKKSFYTLLALNMLGMLVFYHYFFYLTIQTVAFWLLRDEVKIGPRYFAIICLLIVLFSSFVISSYAKGRYVWDWPKNNFKQTVKNMVYLPLHFTQK